MKILITGSNGFIGKNLTAELKNQGYKDIYAYDKDKPMDLLDGFTVDCDYIFHLASYENGPDESLTRKLLNSLELNQNRGKLAYLQPSLKTKEVINEEAMLPENSEVFRFPEIFGKWGKVSEEFFVMYYCEKIIREEDFKVKDGEETIELCYVNDVVRYMIQEMEKASPIDYKSAPVSYKLKKKDLIDLLKEFKKTREDLSIPKVEDPFIKKLYGTFLSYIPSNSLGYDLLVHADDRGAVAEILKDPVMGQLSINIIKPGISKGGHWHQTICEKFLVLMGEGTIRLQKYQEEKFFDYHVSGDKLQIIDIPVGYIHTIINEGSADLLVLMWNTDLYDPKNTDAYTLI